MPFQISKTLSSVSFIIGIFVNITSANPAQASFPNNINNENSIQRINNQKYECFNIIENNYKTSKKKSKKQILDYPGIECENYYPKSIENIRSFYWKNTDRSRNISQKSTTIRICNWMFSQHKKMKKYSQKTTSDQKTVSEETPGINQKSLEE